MVLEKLWDLKENPSRGANFFDFLLLWGMKLRIMGRYYNGVLDYCDKPWQDARMDE